MSRSLPPRPHLDHLRKQAKDLLSDALRQHPSWQLADAQFALARDYGFSSWPAMKAHVDALTTEDGPLSAMPATGTKAGHADDAALAGSWRLDLDASARHPALALRSATLELRVAGSRVTMTQIVEDADGKPSGSSLTIVADGRAQAVDGGGTQHMLVAQWLDARTLEVVDLMHDEEVGRGRYETSADAMRLTVTTAGQRLVFDRQ